MSKYYTVIVGTKPGIYSSWREASKQVIGYKGAVHKSFRLRNDAELYYKNYFNIKSNLPREELNSCNNKLKTQVEKVI